LQPAFELILLAVDDTEIVIDELALLLLHLTCFHLPSTRFQSMTPLLG